MKQIAFGVVMGALAALLGVFLGARLTASAISAGAGALRGGAPPQALMSALAGGRGLPGGMPAGAPGAQMPPSGGAGMPPAGGSEATGEAGPRRGRPGGAPRQPGQPGQPGQVGQPGQPGLPEGTGMPTPPSPGQAPERPAAQERRPRRPGEPLAFTGAIRPAQIALVTAPAAGQIARVYVRDGQRVRTGAPILEMEHLDASRRLIEAEANLKAARERVKTAGGEEAAPASPAALTDLPRPPGRPEAPGRPGSRPAPRTSGPAPRLDPETQLKVAELDAQNARRAVSLATVRAPIAGVVRAVPPPGDGRGRGGEGAALLSSDAALPRAGTPAAPNTPICAVVSAGKPVIVFDVDEGEIGRVYGGQTVAIQPRAFPSMKLTGRVTRIGLMPQARGGSAAFPVTVEVISPLGRVRLGMSARVTLL